MHTEESDLRYAREFARLCDYCLTNPRNSGYDICQECYVSHYTRNRCRTCGSALHNTGICANCQPAEDASYEELLQWEAVRNLPSHQEKAAKTSVIDAMPVHIATNSETCCICLESSIVGKSKMMRLPCMHSFHQECCAMWLSEKLECPTCKQSVQLVKPYC